MSSTGCKTDLVGPFRRPRNAQILAADQLLQGSLRLLVAAVLVDMDKVKV